MKTSDVERLARMRRLVATDGAVRAIRVSVGLSQEEVAQVLNVSQPAVSRWERGERVPRGRAAQDYARLLDLLVRGA